MSSANAASSGVSWSLRLNSGYSANGDSYYNLTRTDVSSSSTGWSCMVEVGSRDSP